MPRPKRPDYNPPADLLSRLPNKPIITLGDKLAALNTMFHRCEIGWRDLHLSIINAIREDIRLSAWRKREQAQRDGASATTEAPLSPNSSGEAGSSIAASPLERKIETAHESLSVEPVTGAVTLNICDLGDPVMLTPDQARQLAALLIEAAGDVDRDTAVRKHYAALASTTTG